MFNPAFCWIALEGSNLAQQGQDVSKFNLYLAKKHVK
jgi:hypothetical protein